MNFLEEKILSDGVIKEGNILKVDNFLNHQLRRELRGGGVRARCHPKPHSS